MGGGRGEAWQGRVVTLGRQTRCLRFDAEIKIARRRQASKQGFCGTHTHTATHTHIHPHTPCLTSLRKPIWTALIIGLCFGLCHSPSREGCEASRTHLDFALGSVFLSLPHTLCLCLSLTLLLRRLLPNVVGNCINYSISSVIRS